MNIKVGDVVCWIPAFGAPPGKWCRPVPRVGVVEAVHGGYPRLVRDEHGAAFDPSVSIDMLFIATESSAQVWRECFARATETPPIPAPAAPTSADG